MASANSRISPLGDEMGMALSSSQQVYFTLAHSLPAGCAHERHCDELVCAAGQLTRDCARLRYRPKAAGQRL